MKGFSSSSATSSMRPSSTSGSKTGTYHSPERAAMVGHGQGSKQASAQTCCPSSKMPSKCSARTASIWLRRAAFALTSRSIRKAWSLQSCAASNSATLASSASFSSRRAMTVLGLARATYSPSASYSKFATKSLRPLSFTITKRLVCRTYSHLTSTSIACFPPQNEVWLSRCWSLVGGERARIHYEQASIASRIVPTNTCP